MDRKERIALLVDQALELTAPEREAFVAAHSDDEAMRREVEELLAADDDMESGFLEQPAAFGWRALEVDAEQPDGPDPMIGRMVGSYRLETLLGRGGMGAVYLARRADDEYEQQVAVKLLHPGLASAGLVRRFRSERQILARLDHPNIAKLLDGGTTEDGQPYLVMERIDGLRIDDYCDEHRLGVRERLLLFREVCDAVRFAHQNLVVHRDLKPSNILVTAQGTPKLLDFGIAKLVESPLPQSREVTKSLVHAMTPSYASPEQLAGGNVTTASDVYSLGVILYQLLTGRLPRRIDLRSPQVLEEELAREPERPSVAASREDGQASSEPLAKRHGLDTRQLRRQLSGDLDTIVLMALRTEPERRYGSVEQLTDDLRRHLEGLPVRARRDTFTYRAGKFLRRNRLAVSAAAVICGLLLGLTATATLQARRVARERETAERQRARAERERDKAQRVADFMGNLFEIAGKTQGITARELLDRGAAGLHGELGGDDPEVRATLLAAVGKAYGNMDLAIEARRHLEEALRSREKLFGPNHLDVAEVAAALSAVEDHAGELAAAERYARRSLDIRERQLGPNDPLVAESLLDLGMVYTDLQRLEAAEGLTVRALHILENRPGPAGEDVANTVDALGLLYRQQAKRARAEAAFRRALAIKEKRFGPDNPAVATELNNLALSLHDQGLFAEAAPLYRRSIELKERAEGQTPRLAASLYNLAYLERELGEYAQAERRLVQAQQIIETTTGPESLHVGNILKERAEIHIARGELDLAEPLLQRGTRMVEAAVGGENRQFVSALLAQARIDFRRGRLAAAAANQERAIAILRPQLGPHRGVSKATRDLARTVASQGDRDRAAKLLAEVVAETEARLKKQPQDREELALVASAHEELGRLAAAAGDQQTATARLRRAVELLAPFAADSHVVEYGRVYAESLVLLGRGDEARPLIDQLLATGWRDPQFLSLLHDHGLG